MDLPFLDFSWDTNIRQETFTRNLACGEGTGFSHI